MTENVELYWAKDEGVAGEWVFTIAKPGRVVRHVLKGIDPDDTEGAKEAAVRAAKGPEHLDDPLAALEASIEQIKKEGK